MAMVSMEIKPLSSVMLWIQIVGLPSSPDGVSHSFHDNYNLPGLNVEVVF